MTKKIALCAAAWVGLLLLLALPAVVTAVIICLVFGKASDISEVFSGYLSEFRDVARRIFRTDS